MAERSQVCPWCDIEYSLEGGYSPAEVEQSHLNTCHVFQSLPVAESRADGVTFVEYAPGILVERRRKSN